MGEIADWEPHREQVLNVLRAGGFTSLVGKIAENDVRDMEIESALRVALLHTPIPYIPASTTIDDGIDYPWIGPAAEDGRAKRRPTLADFAAWMPEEWDPVPELGEFLTSLPVGVQVLGVCPRTEDDLSPGWLASVKLRAYGFELTEVFTLTRRD